MSDQVKFLIGLALIVVITIIAIPSCEAQSERIRSTT